MNCNVIEWPGFVITGVKHSFPVKDSFSLIPKIWQQASMDGTMDQLYALWSRCDMRPPGILGIISRSLADSSQMDYFLAVTTFVDLPENELVETPEGLKSFRFPPLLWAVAEAKGPLPIAMRQAYQQFAAEWLPQSGYAAAPMPVVECYLQENDQQVWFPVVPVAK